SAPDLPQSFMSPTDASKSKEILALKNDDNKNKKENDEDVLIIDNNQDNKPPIKNVGIKIESDSDDENELSITNMFGVKYNIGSSNNIFGDECEIRKRYKHNNNGTFDLPNDFNVLINQNQWTDLQILNILIGNNYYGEQLLICAPTTDIVVDDNKNNELSKETNVTINWLYKEKDFKIYDLYWIFDEKIQKNIPRARLDVPPRYYGPIQAKYIKKYKELIRKYIPSYKCIQQVVSEDESM
ncbi:MAG: hypothetical protein GY755_08765, partial [Chloroflexi bacterium]|nr:hypothetical protein [Chloroflexota bacterium]